LKISASDVLPVPLSELQRHAYSLDVIPPEATTVSPVMYEASSDTKNDTTPDMSAGTAIL
jgi:hypothetical protein